VFCLLAFTFILFPLAFKCSDVEEMLICTYYTVVKAGGIFHISQLFHEHSITNISEKSSPLYILVDSFPEVLQIFPNSHIPLNMMKGSEIYLEGCLLIAF
jgi:hypothetical protein